VPVAKDAKRTSRRLVLGLAALGGFAIAVVAPLAGIDYAATWPASSRQSATFVTVVAGMLAVTIVAANVGTGLRATRPESSAARRIAIAIVLGFVIAVIAFAVMR
jgi:hypothetical protein